MVKMHGDEIVSLSVKKIIKSRLQIEEYFFGYMLYIGQRWKLSKYAEATELDRDSVATALIKKEWITMLNPQLGLKLVNLVPTQKFKDFVEGKGREEAPEAWIDEWYALWPTGIKSGGYYLKTDKKGTLRKMKNFMIGYPQWDKGTIMKATKNYLEEASIRGYSHTKLAPYFIEKDGMSVLAGECEQLEDENEVVIHKDDVYGGDIL